MFRHVINADSGSGQEYLYTVSETLIDHTRYRQVCYFTHSVLKPSQIAHAVRQCQDALLALNIDQAANGRVTNFKIIGYDIVPMQTTANPDTTYIVFICQDFNSAQVSPVMY